MKQVFTLTPHDESLTTDLVAARKYFVAASVSNAAINLSDVTMLNSTQLGEISIIIQTAKGRHGSIHLFSENSELIEVLDLVRFTVLCEICKDAETYESILSTMEPITINTPMTESIPQSNTHSVTTAQKTGVTETRTVPLPNKKNSHTRLIVILLIANLAATTLLSIFTLTRLSQQNSTIKTIVEESLR